jgi:hypothetical protein
LISFYELSSLASFFFASDCIVDASDQALILKFTDYCWDSFLSQFTPTSFLQELDGMKSFYSSPAGQQVDPAEVPAYIVSTRFYTLANMPADAVNIVSMLEEELEADWPEWLKLTINEIIRLLEKLVHSCDAFGVWGPRTVGGLLFSSRNLDYNTDTGLNKYKLISMFHLTDSNGKPAVNGGMYSTLGFSVGLGALAGMSQAGMTVSEMNLDNSRVTFNGVPFPLRLRMVLENSTNLLTAESLWKATNNTNSFNFLIGSAEGLHVWSLFVINDCMRFADAIVGRNGAVALETIRDYTVPTLIYLIYLINSLCLPFLGDIC